jgi:hypothetical protein
MTLLAAYHLPNARFFRASPFRIGDFPAQASLRAPFKGGNLKKIRLLPRAAASPGAAAAEAIPAGDSGGKRAALLGDDRAGAAARRR